MNAFFRKLSWILSRRRKREELDAELRFHLEAERDERIDAGESDDEARRNARIDFGNVSVVREDTRSAWGWIAVEQTLQDLRYAVRTMRRTPVFTALAVVSLALGIGVNTAIFSFADVMLLSPLPVRDPDALVRMTWRTPKAENHGTSRHASATRDPVAGYTNGVFSHAAFLEFHKHTDLFSGVFAYQGTGPLSIKLLGQAEPASGEYVSGDYFRTLGVTPLAGRFIDADDDRNDGQAVIVLSAAFARNRFASAADAVGRRAMINTTPVTIVGVAKPDFFGTDPGKANDFYLPMHTNKVLQPSAAAQFDDPGRFWLEIMARRQPGVTLERVQAQLAPPFQQASADLVAKGKWKQAPSLEVRAGDDGIDGLKRMYGGPLMMLIALTALILALSCSNIANLLLARAASRTREIAVRLSIGAGRARVVKQLITESLALSCLGGALGIGIAIWTERWVTSLVTQGAPFGVEAHLNAKVLAVTVALSVLTGLLFGVAPALRATGGDTVAPLKDARGQTVNGARRMSGRRVLLGAQVAITLVMLVSAGLFVRTLRNYQAIDLGYETDHLLTFGLRTAQAGLSDEQSIEFYRALQRKLTALPGVTEVGLASSALIGDGQSVATVHPVGGHADQSSVVLSVGGEFFSAMKLPIVKGRGLQAADEQPGAPPVVVVDETYARTYLTGREPVGQYLQVPGEDRLAELRFEVVGVAAGARIGALTNLPEPTVYFPLTAGGGAGQLTVVIRSAVEPLTLVSTVRRIAGETNPNVPLTRMATQENLIERTLSREILLAQLCTGLAFLALTIAVIGLYGTVLHDVSRRRPEIGIRIALGARRAQVIGMILREVLIVVSIGALVGIPAAAGATSIAKALLFGVTRSDPATLAVATGLIVLTALVAGFVPARAASRINPAITLRE